MLSAQVPTVLVLAGTLLMAVVIFAPVRAASAVTVSYAPPLPHVPVSPPEPWEPLAPPAQPYAAWTSEVDAIAMRCDDAARTAIVDALADLRSPWACALLARASAEDPSPAVRDAAASALRRAARDAYRP